MNNAYFLFLVRTTLHSNSKLISHEVSTCTCSNFGRKASAEGVSLHVGVEYTDDSVKIPNFFQKKFKIQIFIAVFRFSMKNVLKWAQTNLVLVQRFSR